MTFTIPSTMHAVIYTQPGSADVLQMSNTDTPHPKRGEVLIKMAAAGVNRSDILQRKGIHPPPPGSSDILGLEVAGTIVALGEGVDKKALKQKVCALVPGGGYAEYCTTPYVQCLPIPHGITLIEAASFPETFFTVWINVFHKPKLHAGESLLVQGGSSGIGITAIQLATVLGHVVFATAGSPEKCRACENLGAKLCINYKTDDFVAAIKDATGGKGVDFILDSVGGDYVPREMSLLAEDGRLVFIGAMGGAETKINLGDLIKRRITHTGSSLRPRSPSFKGTIATALRENVWPLIETKKIKPVIYKIFPIQEAAEAHRLMESSEHIGKIILTWNTGD